MKHNEVLIVFTVRPYSEADLKDLIGVYQAAFAEPPWNESWSAEDVEKDLRFAQQQKDSIVLVASQLGKLAGFTWGYKIPLEKFPFLRNLVDQNANYMDEIAVTGQRRLCGIGKQLGNSYLDEVRARGQKQSILRTDERNPASMALFAGIGYEPVRGPLGIIYDPEFSNRVYLRRNL